LSCSSTRYNRVEGAEVSGQPLKATDFDLWQKEIDREREDGDRISLSPTSLNRSRSKRPLLPQKDNKNCHISLIFYQLPKHGFLFRLRSNLRAEKAL
jgi:hypothetical protein